MVYQLILPLPFFGKQCNGVLFDEKENECDSLSNYHHDKQISHKVKQKPGIIMDYNKYKAGIDILDMMLKKLRPYRTSRTWTCDIFLPYSNRRTSSLCFIMHKIPKF